VVKLEETPLSGVRPFTPASLRAPGQGTYAATKARGGALAATDSDRRARDRKDARFELNSLVRGPLAVEEEERRVIDERVREGVAAMAEEARREGAERGYREGLETGAREAAEAVRGDAGDRLARLDSLITALDGARAEIFAANERFLVELVFRVGRMLLLRELKTDRDQVLRLCRQLVEKVGPREQIRIRIAQADAEAAERLKSDLSSAFGALQGLKIEPSPEVGSGGCIVDTEWNVIDATIESQLANLHAALVGEV
jgi:flagellar assembly protein FliH